MLAIEFQIPADVLALIFFRGFTSFYRKANHLFKLLFIHITHTNQVSWRFNFAILVANASVVVLSKNLLTRDK
nr:hypothetical protein [Ningiella sp. W23]